MMSGGVDSLATLRCNRLDFPLTHPAAIQDCLFVHGFDLGGYIRWGRNTEAYRYALGPISNAVEDAGARLIPVYTNLRHLEGEAAAPLDNTIFTLMSHGAALAAVAHVFSEAVSTALIPASCTVTEPEPHGSHPLLAPNYSSADLIVRLDALRLSRVQKVALIADWELALRALRVCLNPLRPAHELNCGKCEKCIRTMTELQIIGKLREARSFPYDQVTAEMVGSLEPPSRHNRSACPFAVLTPVSRGFWWELIPSLRQIGRDDLVRAVEQRVAVLDRYLSRREGGRLKRAVKRIDRACLGGRLSRLTARRRIRAAEETA